MNVGMMKRSAEKLIKAEGRKETLAALSDFAQVCGPEEVLELIRLDERTVTEINALYRERAQSIAERNDLATKLSALEKQQPVAYIRPDCLPKLCLARRSVVLRLKADHAATYALYARPVPAGNPENLENFVKERDAARQQAATLRSALVAVFGTDDLIALEVLKANYRHLGATMPLRRSHEKIIAAIDVLIATHPDNNPET